MSGTSLDGIDTALVDFAGPSPHTLATHYAPFDASLRADLLSLQAAGGNEFHLGAIAANQLARAYAAAVQTVLATARVDAADVEAIGAHGQTVRHRPELGFTIQLNNPALLAELTGITVVADFRSRDIAAGGQGAPLVAAFHHAVFGAPAVGQSNHDRVIVNIGGIANITHLPAHGNISGFDTGPGNALMDLWINRHLNRPHDQGGAWAASGKVLPALLEHMLGEPYFARRPPKSTGRDLFSAAWLAQWLDGGEMPADVQATLCALSARTIADAISKLGNGSTAREAYVCGGGGHNGNLMALLRQFAPDCRWDRTDTLGVPADWVEAVAFAWLAFRLIERQPANVPQVTGAAGPRLLGAIYPA